MRWSAMTGLVCACLAASPARSAEPPPQAKAAYEEGVRLFGAGEYADAIVSFNTAYRIAPNPVLVYNMARAFEELRDFPSAIEFYQRYLKMSPQAEDRAKVEDALRTLQLLLKQQAAPKRGTLVVRSTPDGARVLIDGRPAGQTPLKLTTDAGAHFVAVEKDGFSRDTREISVADGETLEHAVTLVPIVVKRASKLSEASNTGAWVLMGIGTTMLVGGGISGVLALDRDAQLDDISAGRRFVGAQKFDDLQTEGQTYAYLADGLVLGGLAAVVTGGILLFVGDPPTPTGGAFDGSPAWGWTF